MSMGVLGDLFIILFLCVFLEDRQAFEEWERTFEKLMLMKYLEMTHFIKGL